MLTRHYCTSELSPLSTLPRPEAALPPTAPKGAGCCGVGGGGRRGAGHTSKANTVRMHSSTREAGERVLFEQELWGGHVAAVLSPPESLNRCRPAPRGMGGTRTLNETQGAPKPKPTLTSMKGSPTPGVLCSPQNSQPDLSRASRSERVMGKARQELSPPQGETTVPRGVSPGEATWGTRHKCGCSCWGDSDRNPIAKRQAILPSSRSLIFFLESLDSGCPDPQILQ